MCCGSFRIEVDDVLTNTCCRGSMYTSIYGWTPFNNAYQTAYFHTGEFAVATSISAGHTQGKVNLAQNAIMACK